MEHQKQDSRTHRLTQHASIRGQQRGIREMQRQVVFEHGDHEEPVGGGCYRLSISTPQLRLLIAQGIVSPQLADRCARLVLVTDGSKIVTNYQQDL